DLLSPHTRHLFESWDLLAHRHSLVPPSCVLGTHAYPLALVLHSPWHSPTHPALPTPLSTPLLPASASYASRPTGALCLWTR
ncbi:hypothetical protein C0993_011213, partial [Termitomyces sp. T159_Od127]